jgi:hypothetical protein
MCIYICVFVFVSFFTIYFVIIIIIIIIIINLFISHVCMMNGVCIVWVQGGKKEDLYKRTFERSMDGMFSTLLQVFFQ